MTLESDLGEVAVPEVLHEVACEAVEGQLCGDVQDELFVVDFFRLEEHDSVGREVLEGLVFVLVSVVGVEVDARLRDELARDIREAVEQLGQRVLREGRLCCGGAHSTPGRTFLLACRGLLQRSAPGE